MSTLVCFHAHPDDEAIATGGLMSKAVDAGHRVVLITATGGEHGEPQPGVLEEGEKLGDRRAKELVESAETLGADKLVTLGYLDSGMMGEPTNDDPGCFWQADEGEAAVRVAQILTEVDADVLTIYDNHGGYGHPDHLRVHSVGLAAARIAGITNVFESTMNRDHLMSMMRAAAEAARLDQSDSAGATDGETAEMRSPEDFEEFGTLSSDISYRVDVSDFMETKRRALMAHRSQIGPDSFFLTMPPEAFLKSFGSEWFNIPGCSATGGPELVNLLPGLV